MSRLVGPLVKEGQPRVERKSHFLGQQQGCSLATELEQNDSKDAHILYAVGVFYADDTPSYTLVTKGVH